MKFLPAILFMLMASRFLCAGDLDLRIAIPNVNVAGRAIRYDGTGKAPFYVLLTNKLGQDTAPVGGVEFVGLLQPFLRIHRRQQ